MAKRDSKLIDAIQAICTHSFVVKEIVMDGVVIFKEDV